jgi:adenylate cyclase
MLQTFKRYFLKTANKFSFYSIVVTAISLAILSWSQILVPLELNIYDFIFWLRPMEKADERIVIVKWDDKDISSLKETNISDRTLSLLLAKIIEQKPQSIGLDLYRDIPVSSPTISDEENLKFYQSLKNLFHKTDSIYVIEKTVEPKVESPKILQQKDQVAASDVPSDKDQTIRRSYIYPLTTEDGTVAGLPYIGARLAYEYLADQKFAAEEFGNKGLKIFNQEKKIILTPLQNFAGSPAEDKYSFNVLINWRKANPTFTTISVIDILSNRTLDNLFTDKVVLLGGMATSVSDRFQTPLNHWNNSIVFGVEIIAQITSSIISAALDDRRLIVPVYRGVELLLFVFSVASISFLIYKKQNLRSIKLYFLSFGYAVGLSIFLILCAIVSLNLGYWLPVTKALGCIWILYFAMNYYIYTLRESQRVAVLEAFIQNFNHGIGNRLSSIISSKNTINSFTGDIQAVLQSPDQLNQQQINQKLETIFRRTNNISNQVTRIKSYQKQIRDFVAYGYLNKKNKLELININEFIAEVVKRLIDEEDYEYQISIEQMYDPRLKEGYIDKTAVSIVLENLLDNAFYAIAPNENKTSEYTPTVKIETRLKGRLSLQIIIADNGHGIPQEYQEKIFRPFVTFKPQGEGIGLCLVSSVAETFNGSIKVESKENQGSKFIFTIPLID